MLFASVSAIVPATFRSKTMTRPSPLAFAGALFATSLTILSANPAQAATRHVSYADLDLSTASGRAIMDQRIGRAASSVCFAQYRDLQLAGACRSDTVARAKADLDQAIRRNTVQVAAR
jgi:UrcA family protein